MNHHHPEMDFPDGEFRPEASPEPHQNVGGLHVGFDATSELVGPDFERAFRCLDLRTLKIVAAVAVGRAPIGW